MLTAQCSNPLACTHPVTDRLEGVAPDGSYLTTQDSSLLLLLSANTIIRKGASLLSVSDLQVSDPIEVAFTVNFDGTSETLTALIVDKFDLAAQIQTITGNEFVTTGGLRVVTDRYTTVSGLGNPQSPADFKPADHLFLIGNLLPDASFYATAILRV